MLYLLQTLSVWMMGAVGLGLLVGMFSWKAPTVDEKPGSLRRFAFFALPLAAGAMVAWLRWLPGRYGLWLETALLLLAVYFGGCGLGCLARGGFSGGSSKKTPSVAAPAGEMSSPPAMEPVEVTVKAEALALSAAALATVAPTEPEFFDAMPTEAEAEAEAPPARVEEDDLLLIQGVDEDAARRLHDLGVWRFEQIADWTPLQQQEFGERLNFIGPKSLNFWIAQARLLAGGVEPEFARALLRGEGRTTPMAQLDETSAENFLAALPQPITPHANDEIYAGFRPLALLLPPYGDKDDLCRISGVDAATAQKLNALGIWIYGQIARWSNENALWIGSYLAFPGRVAAENWIAQARELAKDDKAT